MNEDIARYVASRALKTTTELTDLIPFLKEYCDANEYLIYARAIASVGADINSKLLELIFSANPNIQKEFEEKIEKYGRVI